MQREYLEFRLQFAKAVYHHISAWQPDVVACTYDDFMQEYSQLKRQIIILKNAERALREKVIKKSQDMNTHSAHIDKIDKALLFLEQEMWAQVEPKIKKRENLKCLSKK
jgi:hypothetical protein